MKVNYLAVLVATLLHFILGGVWYGLIFGNKFIQLMNWSDAQLKEMQTRSNGKEYLIALASSFVLVYILAHFVQYTKARTIANGIQTAFWLWLGFVATTQIATVIFEGRNFGLYLLNVGYQFVGCALAGAILAIWRPREATDASAGAS
jgi:Protein of unknown function (DUF1761)